MVKKKALSILLSVSMLTALTACGQKTEELEPAATTAGQESTTTEGGSDEYILDEVTLVVDGTFNAGIDAYQDKFIEQWDAAVSEKLGHPIHMNIIQPDHSSYSDAVGRLFASGDYPDVILLNAGQYAEYAQTGFLWDMTEAYDNAEFQARMALPEVNQNVRIDGKQYGFATELGGGCITYVKQAWLDAVGMKAEDITDWDSYYAMLKAFTEQDPDGNGKNDTYGVAAAGFIGGEAPYTNYLPQFWQKAYPSFTYDENGVWYDGFNTQETKDALLRLQKAYEDGVIDPESLTMSTKDVREKWWSANQGGSFGAFTYWAGYWNDNLVNNMEKNGVDSGLARLLPIKEMDGYLNRESPVFCIIDDGDGDDSREQAIFDAVIETMFDGDTVQMLWVYGAEGYHWSTEAETIITAEGTDNAKTYEFKDGEFHLRLNPDDPNALWKKNAFSESSMICPLTNGYESSTDLTKICNEFFSENSVQAPKSAVCDALTNEGGTVTDARNEVVAAVVVKGEDVDIAMEKYVDTTKDIVTEILAELNAE